MARVEALDAIRERHDRAAVFLDFDGTLAEIVDHPDAARAVEGAVAALDALSARFALVAIVTGRPGAQVRQLLDAPAVEVHGLYGMEADRDLTAVSVIESVRPVVEVAAATVPGAWVELKGRSLAVHYRGAPDPGTAEIVLGAMLWPIGERNGLQVISGKKVIELAAGRPSKGGLVERLARERGFEAVVFAGDDLADLDAFAALDRLEQAGVHVLRVAVRGPETPQALLDRADVAIDGPRGLLGMLLELAGT
jgi:trehalose 6-phosphate phosphatase